METVTMTLTEFLTARIDEDEAVARAAATPAAWVAHEQPNARDETLPGRWQVVSAEQEYGVPTAQIAELFMEFPYGGERTSAEHIARHDPARVLREVEVKRRLVTYFDACKATEAKYPADPFWNGEVDALSDVVTNLAAVYADHPDFRQEWRT